MGAWSTGPFDNDDAMDWLVDISQADDPRAMIATAFAEEAASAHAQAIQLAAAELAAASRGAIMAEPPPELLSALSDGRLAIADGDLHAALTVCDDIRQRGELFELWAETDEIAKWTAEVDDLIARLRNARLRST